MKLLILTIANLVAICLAEQCRHADDCQHLTCSADTQKMCITPNGAFFVRLCSCVSHTSTTCTTQDTCQKGVCSSSFDRNQHCINGQCACLDHTTPQSLI
ncbi:hypothetical protein ACJMK2_004033 [Sinanodonta woodiana]|uniref:EB domain-containing protein n=1 Tax=Sinanodonta woodiana TaxID=1069815 RepID=A0ABD3XZZ5_SINWO